MNFILILLEYPYSVVVITRHGVRTPLKTFPNDPIVWKCNKTHYNFRSPTFPAPATRLNLIYDVKNIFNGDCYNGQLLPKGYE
jgi:hypothetical protein